MAVESEMGLSRDSVCPERTQCVDHSTDYKRNQGRRWVRGEDQEVGVLLAGKLRQREQAREGGDRSEVEDTAWHQAIEKVPRGLVLQM